jgi:diguanylate cyclase
MVTEIPLFASGLLFGAVLLCAGLGIGLWAGRRTPSAVEPASLNDYHLLNLLQGLFKWTDGFANDVSQYRQVVDNACEHFNSVEQKDADTSSGSVMGMLSQIVQANDNLQQRLERAETTLQDQAEEIAGYMSEARTDALTGLSNRRVFDDELTRRIAELRRSGSPVSVLLADIDHFKRFNDQYGHQAGDSVLQQVARTLKNTMRESDLVTRIGGEEFAVILPGSEEPDARLAAERARQEIEHASFRFEGRTLNVSISCGAAQASRDESVATLVKRADQAMYASKDAGRNLAHWHDGQVCIPITAKGATLDQATGDEVENLTADSGFRQVCSTLRERLLTVAEEEAASSD